MTRDSGWRSALAALLLAALASGVRAQDAGNASLNGFQLSPAKVPVAEILRGGPPRDGIPALDHPEAMPAAAAPWHDDETVIGVNLGTKSRAYPIALLNWHELVNDTLGDQAILVSYCPLCGSGMVFDRRVAKQTRSFGVSGLLYKSDLLLYDRESESLWSQISAHAVTGPAAGQRLRVLRSQLTTWGRWKAAHPDTTVLGLDTGHKRDYASTPYGEYALSDRLLFPVPLDPRYHPKMPTLGLRVLDGSARAYPAVELVRAGGRVEDRFRGYPVVVSYDEESQVFDIEVDPEVEVIEGYWFAWAAFHPETTVFVVSDEPAPIESE